MAHRNLFSVLTATEKGYVSSRFIMEVLRTGQMIAPPETASNSCLGSQSGGAVSLSNP